MPNFLFTRVLNFNLLFEKFQKLQWELKCFVIGELFDFYKLFYAFMHENNAYNSFTKFNSYLVILFFNTKL
jgi:hypothetical protein